MRAAACEVIGEVPFELCFDMAKLLNIVVKFESITHRFLT